MMLTGGTGSCRRNFFFVTMFATMLPAVSDLFFFLAKRLSSVLTTTTTAALGLVLTFVFGKIQINVCTCYSAAVVA